MIENLGRLLSGLIPVARLESGLGLRGTQMRAPEIEITLGTIGDARLLVTSGRGIVAGANRTAGQVGIRAQRVLRGPASRTASAACGPLAPGSRAALCPVCPRPILGMGDTPDLLSPLALLT